MLLARRQLFHNHRQRIRLGAPDIELRRSLQKIGNNVRFQLRELIGGAVKLRNVDRKILDKRSEFVLILRYRIEIFHERFGGAPVHQITDTTFHLRFFI